MAAALVVFAFFASPALSEKCPDDLEAALHLFQEGYDEQSAEFLLQLKARQAVNHSCTSDKLCCAKGEGQCNHFCALGQEILSRDRAAGWQVQGSCHEKWLGFCREDEDCSKGWLCDRPFLHREGTCKRDLRCQNLSCGPGGHCLHGSCRCSFQFSGKFCEVPATAFAFLFYGHSVSNLVQARVLVRSIREQESMANIYAIVPDAYANQTSVAFLEILSADGVLIFRPHHIPMPPAMLADPIISKRWSAVMDKLNFLLLTNHSQVAIVDVDVIFDVGGDRPSQLFDECSTELCAVRDGDRRFLNAGVLVARPSHARLHHLVSVLASERHHYDMPEQIFLTHYVQQPENRISFAFIDDKWNSCVGGGMLLNAGLRFTGFNVLHSCSWTLKPPQVRLQQPSEQLRHTLLLWQSMHARVDPCSAKPSEAVCRAPHSIGNSSGPRCSWCRHYCSTSSVPCDAGLFNRSVLQEEMHLQSSAALVQHCKSSQQERYHSALPSSGHWAWPKSAIYQVLLDRFATEQPRPCRDLADYCGGTLAGTTGKLDYLEHLGIDGILLSPVVENMPGGYHGYWQKDLTAINPHFGSEADLAGLVFQAHLRRFKVIADVNLNHAGSPLMKWEKVSQLHPFSHREAYHSENCSLWSTVDFLGPPSRLEHCSLFGMPDFNHQDPKVWKGLMQWLRKHVDKYGFDGIRVDAAKHMPREFVHRIPEEGAPIPAFFEVPGAFVERKTLRTLVPILEQEPLNLQLNFLDNNDLPRFVALLKGEQALYHNALVCLTMATGVPMLLYGSEQAAEGRSEELPPGQEHDGYRVPLWEIGYNRQSETFRLLSALLWLRRHYGGFHNNSLQVLHADHSVLAFARGKVQVLLSSSGESKNESRILWANSSCETQHLCDLLSRREDRCVAAVPGNFRQVDFLGGMPQVMVPREVFEAYRAFLRKTRALHATPATQIQEQHKNISGHPSNKTSLTTLDLRMDHWRNLPRPPQLQLETLPRFRRAERQPGVVQLDDPGWPSTLEVPSHLDLWYPPLGAPPSQGLEVQVPEACATRLGPVLVRRPGQRFVLLCSSDATCSSSASASFWAQAMVLQNHRRPLLHLHYDTLYTAFYHMVVEILPRFVEYLPELRQGNLDLLVNSFSDAKLMNPLLARLGVPSSSVFAIEGRTAACAPRLIFKVFTPSTNFLSPERFRALRQSLGLYDGAAGKHVVLLSRGNSSRTLANEDEVVAMLKELGRPVDVLHAEPGNFQETLEILSRASLLVGGHGANLANMIYAPMNSKVLEIVPQVPFPMVNFHYRSLAGALGFEYLAVAVAVEDFDAELAMTLPAQAIRSYSVNVTDLMVAARTLLEAGSSTSFGVSRVRM
eukprot:TRINITY_DN23775_c0_g1_i3.p1 TRINITY_DN23775_c0_g1~~TRINITY_DN23775_c0_g1_i3.p1  ORF type:complete len:1355 (+),score=215.64 TRINITY_DN23775_c0_g1_i3:79-4143(+)